MGCEFVYWLFNSRGGNILFVAIVLPGIIFMVRALIKGDSLEPPVAQPPPTIINVTVMIDGVKAAKEPKPKPSSRLDRYLN